MKDPIEIVKATKRCPRFHKAKDGALCWNSDAERTEQCDCHEKALGIIRALEAEGWRLVKEPTPEMLDAARKHLGITTPLRAALSAAPRWSDQ